MFPSIPIVADLKTMDAGRTEVECAAKAGASIVVVLGVAGDSTLRESIEAAANRGTQWMVVEQDQPGRLTHFESATASILNIREAGLHPECD